MEIELPYFFDTKLKKFSRAMEGGPGKPLTICIQLILIFVLFFGGLSIMSNQGISSGGPALIFLSVFWMATLLFWILIKAGLRDTNVHISIDASGVAIC
jgi:hypothetical protein